MHFFTFTALLGKPQDLGSHQAQAVEGLLTGGGNRCMPWPISSLWGWKAGWVLPMPSQLSPAGVTAEPGCLASSPETPCSHGEILLPPAVAFVLVYFSVVFPDVGGAYSSGLVEMMSASQSITFVFGSTSAEFPSLVTVWGYERTK